MNVPRLKVLVVGCSSGVGLQVPLFCNFMSRLCDSMVGHFPSGYGDDGYC